MRLNKEEVEGWLFDRCQIEGHICDGIKGLVNGDLINVGYRDRMTGEVIWLADVQEDEDLGCGN